MNQRVFIFIGRSGCGKGTQAKLLQEYLKKNDPSRDILYVQAGAEFREFIKGDSDTQKLSKLINDKGGLQPEFLAVYMWVNILVKNYKKNNHVIMDGMPRKYHEAGVLHSVFSFYGLEKPCVINIDITENESVQRLMARGRMDDKESEIRERLSWYDTEVAPAIEFYRNNPNYKFLRVKGDKPIEVVFQDIIDSI